MDVSTRVDFRNSRLFWNHETKESHGAFNIESVLRIYEKNKIKETFVLATGVLAGNMYVSGRLVQNPPYYFQIAASNTRHIIYRTDAINKSKWTRLLCRKHKNGILDTLNKNSAFKALEYRLIEEDCIRVSSSYSDLERHYMQLSNFTVKININLDEEQRAELEFPVKHINISPEKKMFQVETGAVLLISTEYSDLNDLSKLLTPSFVHFNSFNYADFSIDFPYGVRSSKTRGDFNVKRLVCEVQLYSTKFQKIKTII